MPEIYIREKDKQDAKIREVEKRCKALDDECRVLRQRLAVVEDRFREPEPTPQSDICLTHAPEGVPVASIDYIPNGEIIITPISMADSEVNTEITPLENYKPKKTRKQNNPPIVTKPAGDQPGTKGVHGF